MKKLLIYLKLNLIYYITGLEMRVVGLAYILGYMIKNKKIFRRQKKEKVEEMRKLLKTWSVKDGKGSDGRSSK